MVTETKEGRKMNQWQQTQKCPICGKKWEMTCSPLEWGYGSRDSLKPWKENALVLFCSRPCMDEYTKRMRDERIRRLKLTNSYRVWRMYELEYKTAGDIARTLGMNVHAVEAMVRDVEERHWKDLDWIVAFG